LQNQIKEIQNLVIKDFQLSAESSHEILSFNKLKAWLTKEIHILMDRDFQHLLNILYRIDISEQKAKEAFSNLNPARRLAELIIARELQKMETRTKYT